MSQMTNFSKKEIIFLDNLLNTFDGELTEENHMLLDDLRRKVRNMLAKETK